MSDRSQPTSLAAELFGGFWLGSVTSAGFAYVTFGDRVLSPRDAGFETIVLGVLTAAMLVLVERGRLVEGVVLIPVYTWLRIAFAQGEGWRVALTALLLSSGVFLVAVIFGQMSRLGIRFGKFLVAGPLLGGVCLAVAPISQYHAMSVYDSFDPLMVQLFIGIVIGDGAGLGVELSDLYFRLRRRLADPVPAVSEKPCPR